MGTHHHWWVLPQCKTVSRKHSCVACCLHSNSKRGPMWFHYLHYVSLHWQLAHGCSQEGGQRLIRLKGDLVHFTQPCSLCTLSSLSRPPLTHRKDWLGYRTVVMWEWRGGGISTLTPKFPRVQEVTFCLYYFFPSSLDCRTLFSYFATIFI